MAELERIIRKDMELEREKEQEESELDKANEESALDATLRASIGPESSPEHAAQTMESLGSSEREHAYQWMSQFIGADFAAEVIALVDADADVLVDLLEDLELDQDDEDGRSGYGASGATSPADASADIDLERATWRLLWTFDDPQLGPLDLQANLKAGLRLEAGPGGSRLESSGGLRFVTGEKRWMTSGIALRSSGAIEFTGLDASAPGASLEALARSCVFAHCCERPAGWALASAAAPTVILEAFYGHIKIQPSSRIVLRFEPSGLTLRSSPAVDVEAGGVSCQIERIGWDWLEGRLTLQLRGGGALADRLASVYEQRVTAHVRREVLFFGAPTALTRPGYPFMRDRHLGDRLSRWLGALSAAPSSDPPSPPA